MDDLDLLRRYREGSEEAFRALVDRHGRLVYSVCLRQLGRPDLAEDAVQITFALLAAKAASLSRAGSLAAWLQRAAWYAARRLGRGEGRRERHEKGVEMRPPQSPEPSPEVDEALAALPDRYRDPVCLRYLEQRPLEEVARRLGCGVDAARMRIQRGLEKMRVHLDRRGARYATAALALLLGERLLEAAPPAGLLTRVASEVLAGRAAAAHAPLLAQLGRRMAGTAARAAALAVAVALLSVVALTAATWTGKATTSSAAARQRGAALGTTASTRATSAAAKKDVVSTARARVVGHILCLPDGRPAPGLRVAIWPDDTGEEPTFVFTRDDGSFEQDLPEGRYRVDFHSLVASSPGGLLDLPGAILVTVPPPHAPAAFYYPEHEFERTWPSEVHVDAYAGHPGVAEFRVKASRLITGWLRTEDGQLPKELMAVLKHDRLPERQDAEWVQLKPLPDGRYELPHAYEGSFRVEWLKIEAAGYLPGLSGAFDVPSQGDVRQIDLHLRRGAAIVGGIEEPDGGPAVDAEVSIHPEFSVLDRPEVQNYSDNRVLVDEHGRFRLTGLVPGRYRGIAEERGRRLAPKEFEIEVLPGRSIADAGRIVLEPGARLAGRVVDPEGRPIQGAYLSLFDSQGIRNVPSRESDVDGRFVFEQVRAPGGRLRSLSAYATGYLQRSLQEVAVGPELVLTLEPACRLEATLVWAGEGEAARKVVVALAGVSNGKGESSELRVRPGAAHPIKYDDLPAGEYALTVSDLVGNVLAERKVTLASGLTELQIRW